MVRKIFVACLILVALYLGIGLAFHLKWKSELAACREMRRAQGEFVEPEVFGGVLVGFSMLIADGCSIGTVGLFAGILAKIRTTTKPIINRPPPTM